MPTDVINRGMTASWRRREGAEAAPGADLVARVLAARRITDSAEAAAFLDPSLTHLHDPSLLPDADRAAALILDTVSRSEPIAIYGDYDVDGITATAILYHTLKQIDRGCDVRTYVPHRLEEGYGLNAEAIRQLAADGAKLIVSVDCGVTAFGPARAAREAGADLIITDHHHLPREEDGLPDAYAIVHPQKPGSAPYPFAHLSGAGVAYKLAWRLLTMRAGTRKVPQPERDLLLGLLGFAALGTIADVVPLVGENRVLARFGLGRVKGSPFEGLAALVNASGLGGQNVDSEHAGFALGPRLNAAGRMGHARDAVELFTTATGPRATEIAENLSRLNTQRRATELRIAEQAMEMAEAARMTSPDRRAIVLAHDDWHQGVVGIVCSRLVERFCRPTILMQRREGRCCGSGRSVRGFSLHGALERCAGRLVRFGGHDMAAGLEVQSDALDAFAEEFIGHANGALTEDDLVPRLSIDCDAGLTELTAETVGRLERLAPFGMENPRPRIHLGGLKLTSKPMPLGAGAKHASITVARDGRVLRMLGWNWAARLADIPAGVDLDAVVSPKLSYWNGRVSVEPEIVDLLVRS